MSGCLIWEIVLLSKSPRQNWKTWRVLWFPPCNSYSTAAALSWNWPQSLISVGRPLFPFMCRLSEEESLRLLWWYMWVGPVPGLEVAPESVQVQWREVSSDAFPQPPLPLCCAGTARPAELIPEVFPSHPPERDEDTGEWGRMRHEAKIYNDFDGTFASSAPFWLRCHITFVLMVSGELCLADWEETIRGGAGSETLSVAAAACPACCLFCFIFFHWLVR